jgi:sodium-dependent dicarboxylate transporter 2/3/5
MFSLISTIAPTLNINPIFLMLAVTVSSTAAFMSPIASPVNAVTYGSIKGISLKEMFYKGLLLNILSSIWIIIVFFYFLSS